MTIVPRWEWRVFADDLEPAASRLAALTPELVHESDEIYLLAPDSDASVKVRDELIDVKELRAVNEDGLEQWMPVLKASFPLAAADVGFVLDTLHADHGPIEHAALTLDDVVGASPDVRAVPTHKRRTHYSIGGCMAEVTEMQAGGAGTRTLAVESEDPARVSAVVRELGMESATIECVARGLKALTGFGARRFAVIDVGTNSVKFVIGERGGGADGEWRTLVDRAEVTRLGEGLGTAGRLQPAPIQRTVDAIAAMKQEADSLDVEAIAAVGTAGLRMAPNAEELITAVQERCGIRVEVIPAEEEARLAYLAARSTVARAFTGAVVVFDTGGGSSQFTFGHGDEVEERFSVNVGAARLTEHYGLDRPVAEQTLSEACEAIAADLDRVGGRTPPDALIGMGGALTNLAAVKHELPAYDPDVVNGTVLDVAEIDRQIELYRTRGPDERRAIVGLQPARAEVILAGACVVRTVLRLLGRDSLTVCDRGLRHALLAERFAP